MKEYIYIYPWVNKSNFGYTLTLGYIQNKCIHTTLVPNSTEIVVEGLIPAWMPKSLGSEHIVNSLHNDFAL